MSPLLFKAVAVTLIQLVLFVAQNGVGADFSDNCDNSTNSLSCIHTYEQLYNSLAKSDNSFHIASALYPAKRPSSVRVFVNLYGPNKVENLGVEYTWSLSCLYVALPVYYLQIASLGSILVTPRTQTLDITIPHFCCNVSKKEDGRGKAIGDMIEHVLASLQDLAISPGIRDPRLNTAECVIKGHGLRMTDTGSKLHIIITLLVIPPLIACLGSPALVLLLTEFIEDIWFVHVKSRHLDLRQKRLITNTVNAFHILNEVLIFIGSPLLLFIPLMTFIEMLERRKPWEALSFGWLYPSLAFFPFLSSFVNGLHHRTCIGEFLKDVKKISNGNVWLSGMPYFLNAFFIIFSSCWMLIGIMLNPTWGLTVALIIYFTYAAFIYTAYVYYSLTSGRPEEKFAKPTALYLLACTFSFLLVIGLIIIAVFAGQSFYARETADEMLKTAMLTVLGSFFSWFSWKKFLKTNQTSKNEQALPPSSDTPITPLTVNPLHENNETVAYIKTQPLLQKESSV